MEEQDPYAGVEDSLPAFYTDPGACHGLSSEEGYGLKAAEEEKT